MGDVIISLKSGIIRQAPAPDQVAVARPKVLQFAAPCTIVGLDLGQASDPAALVCLRRESNVYRGVAFKRWKLGTPYPLLVEELCKGFDNPEVAGAELVVDGTGVGRPIVDMIRRAKPKCKSFWPVMCVGGISVERRDEFGYWHVTKGTLVSSLMVLLQQRRLNLPADSEDAKALAKELAVYQVKIGKRGESFNAQQGKHDDLVFAAALAAWRGERGNKIPNVY